MERLSIQFEHKKNEDEKQMDKEQTLTGREHEEN